MDSTERVKIKSKNGLSFSFTVVVTVRHLQSYFLRTKIYFTVIDSYKPLDWKGPLKPTYPTRNLILPSQALNHVPSLTSIHFFKFQASWLYYCNGWCVPMHENPLSEEIFHYMQSKPPLLQPEAKSSCLIAC